MLKHSNASVSLGLMLLVALAQFQIFHHQEMLLDRLTNVMEAQRELNLPSEFLPQGPLGSDSSEECLDVLPDISVGGPIVESVSPGQTFVVLLSASFERSTFVVLTAGPASAENMNAPVSKIACLDPSRAME